MVRTFLFILLAMHSFSFAKSNTIQKKESPTQVAEKAIPAVVFIAAESSPYQLYWGPDEEEGYFRSFYEWLYPASYSHGSGFLISPEGHIVTCAHVVKNRTDLQVALLGKEKRIYSAKILGSDPRTDMAVIQIVDAEGETFPFLEFADSRAVRVGESVLAIGNPRTEHLESSVSMGVVSGVDRNHLFNHPIEGYIQSDVSVNRGSSGGPLLNLEGKVIGHCTWGYASYFGYQGLEFFVPSYTQRAIANQIIENGTVRQGFLGVDLETTAYKAYTIYEFSGDAGAYVLNVIEESPANVAGLQTGDRIIEINGYSVSSPQTLRNMVCVLPPDTSIELKIVRDKAVLNKKITLGSDELSKEYSIFSSNRTKLIL